jgi:hypothetical protein
MRTTDLHSQHANVLQSYANCICTHLLLNTCRSILVGVTLAVVSLGSSTSETATATATALQPPERFTPQTEPVSFTVYLRNCGLPDFLIPYDVYSAAMSTHWYQGMRVEADFADRVMIADSNTATDGDSGAKTVLTASRGTVIDVSVR